MEQVALLWLKRSPEATQALEYLFGAYYLLRKYPEAEKVVRQLSHKKGDAGSAFNLAMTLLHQEKYEEGFQLYESRFEAQSSFYKLGDHTFPMPRWKGEKLEGKSVLVWAEQGLGDVIQFSRFITKMANQGAVVDLLLTQGFVTLEPLMMTLEGVNQIYTPEKGELTINKKHDFHCPIMSVLHLFSVNVQNISPLDQYLSSPLSHHKKWTPLKDISGFKVGICWGTEKDSRDGSASMIRNQQKNNKSIALDELIPLFDTSEVSWVNLKYPINQDEVDYLQEKGIANLSDKIHNFADTAAIIDHLDLVVSIDTSIAHLSGAMGKPTIVLLPWQSDWRWGKGVVTPWYPRMHLYRQTKTKNWKEVIEVVVRDLERKISNGYG